MREMMMDRATVRPLVGFEITDGIRKVSNSSIIQYLASIDRSLRWINVLHTDNSAKMKSRTYVRYVVREYTEVRKTVST